MEWACKRRRIDLLAGITIGKGEWRHVRVQDDGTEKSIIVKGCEAVEDAVMEDEERKSVRQVEKQIDESRAKKHREYDTWRRKGVNKIRRGSRRTMGNAAGDGRRATGNGQRVGVRMLVTDLETARRILAN